MKVAFITMDNREHLKDYACPKPYFGTAPEALLQGFAADPGTEVHVISCLRREVESPEKLAENIWFHPLTVPKSGWMSTLYQGCIRKIRTKLRDIRPDIVHGQGTERYCAFSAVASGYPNVITIHGNMRLIAKLTRPKPFSFNWLNPYFEAFTIPRAGGVVCISNYTRGAVQNAARRTWVVPNAVDSAFLALGEKRLGRGDLGKVNNEGAVDGGGSPALNKLPVILVVANVDERKNQNAFIRALDPLAERQSFQVRFFGSCGDSEYVREFRQLVAERSWCHYGGMIGRQELGREFETADMLALPTNEDNCPMVVLEAMASGLPVMASKVGGVPDLIDGDTTGLFCNPKDPASFREGVGRLLGDPLLADRLARAARQSAVEKYHPKVIAARHLEIYREVLGW